MLHNLLEKKENEILSKIIHHNKAILGLIFVISLIMEDMSLEKKVASEGRKTYTTKKN